MREIGLGYDASPESERALEVARALAAEHGAKLSAFEAVSFPTSVFTGPPGADERATIPRLKIRDQVLGGYLGRWGGDAGGDEDSERLRVARGH